jgi:hypothetical protein
MSLGSFLSSQKNNNIFKLEVSGKLMTLLVKLTLYLTIHSMWITVMPYIWALGAA